MKFKRYFDRSKRQNSIYRPPSIVADLYFTQQSARIQLIIYLIFTQTYFSILPAYRTNRVVRYLCSTERKVYYGKPPISIRTYFSNNKLNLSIKVL